MTHANAPLSVEGRRRLIERCQHQPIAHVAAQMGISRACASKWVNRWRRDGDDALLDRSSAPAWRPTRTSEAVVFRIEEMRRDRKWSANRIAHELNTDGTGISVRTVSRWLVKLGLNRRRFIDPTGEDNRNQPKKIVAAYRGHMIHVDVKKVGRIPDGGGWRIHGRDSHQAKHVNRVKSKGTRAGYTFLHSAIDGYSRLAYTEALDDEKASTAVGFWRRARAWFAAHGINRITRVVTDNGSCYRATVFTQLVAAGGSRHHYIRPHTPKHNGKVERYNRIMVEELLYNRAYASEAQRRQAVAVWNIHYNYHRPHSSAAGHPPVTRVTKGVTNLMASYI